MESRPIRRVTEDVSASQPRYHSGDLGAMLQELVVTLRSNSNKIKGSKPQALHGASAQAVQALASAFRPHETGGKKR